MHSRSSIADQFIRWNNVKFDRKVEWISSLCTTVIQRWRPLKKSRSPSLQFSWKTWVVMHCSSFLFADILLKNFYNRLRRSISSLQTYTGLSAFLNHHLLSPLWKVDSPIIFNLVVPHVYCLTPLGKISSSTWWPFISSWPNFLEIHWLSLLLHCLHILWMDWK